MNLTEMKAFAKEEKEKSEKSLKREDATKKELQDDTYTLKAIEKLIEDSTPIGDNPFEDYETWKEAVKKQIKSGESSLKGFDEDRAFIAMYDFILAQSELPA